MRTRLLLATMLAGAGLVATATGANAASPAPATGRTTAALAFDINGPWTDDGRSKPVIASAGNVVVIDMSFAHRPTATGAVIDASSIVVTFPDAGTYIGTLDGPTVLRWSNGSSWQKVYTGPTVIDLNDSWTDGRTNQHISQVNGSVKISMSVLHRPDATGLFVSPSLFLVHFPDDSNTPYATLSADPDVITWSNGSRWMRTPPPPGNPQCLQPGILC